MSAKLGACYLTRSNFQNTNANAPINKKGLRK